MNTEEQKVLDSVADTLREQISATKSPTERTWCLNLIHRLTSRFSTDYPQFKAEPFYRKVGVSAEDIQRAA